MPISPGEIMKITPWNAGGYGLVLLVLILFSYVQWKEKENLKKDNKEIRLNERQTLLEVVKLMESIPQRLDISDDVRLKLKSLIADMPSVSRDLTEVRRMLEELNRKVK